MAKPIQRTRAIDRVAGSLIARYISFAYNSSTQPPLLDEHLEAFRSLHPFILALWHGQFMLLPALPRGDTPTRVMLALHSDAEMMAEALKRHDLELIRGAGAGGRARDRGGANAFRAAAVALENGFSVAMTADVPPGPARKAGHGIVTLAKVSGRPILPVALASSRYISLNTWSRMTINLPGSHLGGSIGDPIYVPANATPDELEACRLKVEQQLNIATTDAYARAGVDPRRSTPLRGRSIEGTLVPPGKALKFYRRATSLARPLSGLILSRRAKRGKEDLARRGERIGIASRPRPSGQLCWFHAASVGETAAVLPLIADLQTARPDLNVLLTTGTVTSAELALTRLSKGGIHQYLPLDAPEYVRRFLEHWRPDLGVFIESEIWPNLILEASARDVPLVLINARMSKESFRRWRKRPGMALPLFTRFKAALTQNNTFSLRYTELGVQNVIETGNLKIDAPPLPVDAKALTAFRAAVGERPVWLAASTHPDEERIIAATHAALKIKLPRLLTVIAPRHRERGGEILATIAKIGLHVAQRSSNDPIAERTEIYLADTLGELGTFFAACPVAFIGKSFSTDGGGHNPIEAIRHGTAVVTGPSWFNFEDAYKALFTARGAIEVKSPDDLADTVHRLLTDKDVRATLTTNAGRALERLAGAHERTLKALLMLLGGDSARSSIKVTSTNRRASSESLQRAT
jgi:3-deoxy-D-manno-octulosonic-acid transferase